MCRWRQTLKPTMRVANRCGIGQVQGLNACLPQLLEFFSQLMVTCVPREMEEQDEGQRQELCKRLRRG